ncbi:hypothetical protein, partial [Streptomyces minutiscleroticus]|uniref:hypothetical protein n=1 Tax=Streptomyces minutiscleroticus TaxID=68238 RepID=UPI00332E0DE9
MRSGVPAAARHRAPDRAGRTDADGARHRPPSGSRRRRRSTRAVRELAIKKGFGDFSYVFPIGIDA